MTEGPRLFSRKTAQEVLESLVAVVRHPGTDIMIEIVYRDLDHETDELHPPIWLSPTDADVIVLADDSEIIQCKTHEGFRASVLLGKKSERTQQPAEIILGTK